MSQKWIAGYDFSPCADAAVIEAAEELALLGGSLVLVHAYRKLDKHVGFDLAQASPALAPFQDPENLIQDYVVARLEATAKKLSEDHDGLPVEARIVEGHPSECIVAVADELDADRIVLGTHGLRGIKRFFLGSVTERVLKLTDRPVLVIKYREG